MAGLVPAIHAFLVAVKQDVDAQHKACARAGWTRVPGMTGYLPRLTLNHLFN